jgi:(1->4)-alpha-D-glucan 1-alpha-D-glucosylmutase
VPEQLLPNPGQPPISSYRLQLQPEFGFAAAAASAGYLAELGVSHVYLSPILQAAPGSTHGYDVVDHSRISADLGGETAFRDMVRTFRTAGLGVIVDIVPNHMAIPVPESLNRPLWSVLRDGPDSEFASWFDVDWTAQDGRLLLPVLGGPLEDCLGDLTLARQPTGRGSTAEPVLRYFDHVFPVRPDTERLPLPDLLAEQYYRLADWRLAATELNWRRFFDISTLIAVRVEDPEVFEATHAVILGLVAEGLIDGLRVDHPDGLADPRGYLGRLAERTGGRWVCTEKILSGDERLPADWPCAGTTGYDSLGAVGGLFLDPAGAQPLATGYVQFTGGAAAFAGVAEAAKRAEAEQALAAEVARLAQLARESGHPALTDYLAADLTTALTELLTAMPVYRAYVVPGEPAPPESAAILDQAAAAARPHLPAHLHPLLAAAADLALTGPAPFVTLFQQVCGPVMAKGVEDTAFYRWSRLTALNEVGGDPDRFGREPAEFHAFAAHLARHWPGTLTTLSTHDTKRQEDVRARLAVLAEIPQAWLAEVTRWHDRAAALASGLVPEPDTEYLMWQTLTGGWPLDRERLTSYLVKAMREAKTRTSWTDPDAEYEAMVLSFAEQVLDDDELTSQLAGFVAALGEDARANSLGMKLVQLTMPGVADLYQGCELAGLALVDPDNRRPADFTQAREMLAALRSGVAGPAGRAGLGAGRRSGGSGGSSPRADIDAEKLLITTTALKLRQAHPDWFAAGYQPLAAEGPAAGHAIAFARGAAVTVATRLPAGLRRAGGWAGTVLPLPAGTYQDLLTGATLTGPRPLLATITQRHPVAILIPAGSPLPDLDAAASAADDVS